MMGQTYPFFYTIFLGKQKSPKKKGVGWQTEDVNRMAIWQLAHEQAADEKRKKKNTSKSCRNTGDANMKIIVKIIKKKEKKRNQNLAKTQEMRI